MRFNDEVSNLYIIFQCASLHSSLSHFFALFYLSHSGALCHIHNFIAMESKNFRTIASCNLCFHSLNRCLVFGFHSSDLIFLFCRCCQLRLVGSRFFCCCCCLPLTAAVSFQMLSFRFKCSVFFFMCKS